MYKKYLTKELNREKYDCCHLASEFLNDNFEIDTSIIDNYSRVYDIRRAYDCIIDGFTKNDFVEVTGDYQKGDIIVIRRPMGTCYVCVDNKTALTIQKQVLISEIVGIVNHLRHRSLL